MNSVSSIHHLFILILFIAYSFHFSNSQLIYNAKGEQIQVVSRDDINVGRKMGSKFLSEFSKIHHSYNQCSVSHKNSKPPNHDSDEGRKDQKAKSTIQTVVIVAVFSIGLISVSIFCVVVFLVCKRSRRESNRGSNGTDKVSFDPDPSSKLFYLNLLAPPMGIASSRKHSPSLSKRVLLNESMPACNPTRKGEPAKLESQNMSCRDENTLSQNSLPHSSEPNLLKNSDATLPKNPIPKPSTLSPEPCTGNDFTEPTQTPLISSVRSIPKPPPPPLAPPIGPPFLRNGGKSRQLPPLPSCTIQQTTPVGKDGTPLPKLKPLHWDKVRASPNHSMVWDKIRASSFEFDEQMIESLFGYDTQSTAKTEEAKTGGSSPDKHILDNKRLQNLTILLKALGATTDQICEALIQSRGLGSQQLQILANMEPTKEEMEKLSSFQGNAEELSSVEKFIKAIVNIPFAFSRVQVMVYKETFEDEVVHLKNSFAMLKEACKELRSSRFFFRLLEAVLKTGNHMNVGTIRGGAKAFKLDTLLKLADVKGTDGKTTLLHFVVQEIVRSEGEIAMEKNKNEETTEEREEIYRATGIDIVTRFSTELCNVRKTASVDLDVLACSIANLMKGMNQMKDLVDKLCMGERNQIFVNSIKSFLEYVERTIEGLKKDEDLVLAHVKDITEYYHGNVSREESNPLRIFVIVRDFLGMLDRVCTEVRSLKAC